MKIIASPAPSRTRAAIPASKVPAKANHIWPPVIRVSPVTMRRFEPYRSISTPTGICIAAYTASWSTVNVASCAAVMPKRSAASSPATPSEVRWKTARM